MKKVLAFDIDQTLNIAKTPIPDEIADLLKRCLHHFEICPISGQKFDQFLIQIVNRLKDPTPEELSHLHLFVAQGTQYYRFNKDKNDWELVYNYPLTDEQETKISETIEKSAKELFNYLKIINKCENISEAKFNNIKHCNEEIHVKHIIQKIQNEVEDKKNKKENKFCITSSQLKY